MKAWHPCTRITEAKVWWMQTAGGTGPLWHWKVDHIKSHSLWHRCEWAASISGLGNSELLAHGGQQWSNVDGSIGACCREPRICLGVGWMDGTAVGCPMVDILWASQFMKRLSPEGHFIAGWPWYLYWIVVLSPNKQVVDESSETCRLHQKQTTPWWVKEISPSSHIKGDASQSQNMRHTWSDTKLETLRRRWYFN